MPAVEIVVMAKHCLRQTCVNDAYVVSTILRNEEQQEFDALIGALEEALDVGDIGRADVSASGDYETMVFPGTDGEGITNWTELDFRRYDSEDEAREGHEEMVTKWLEMPIGLSRNLEER